MGVWSIIAIEGFCMFSIGRKKKTTYHKVVDFKTLKTKKLPECDNTMYNPAPRPKWCQRQYKGSAIRVPQYQCLASNCPHFAYAEYEGKENEKL